MDISPKSAGVGYDYDYDIYAQGGAPETAGPSAVVKPAGTCMPNGVRDRARGGASVQEEKEVLESFLCNVCRSGRLERSGLEPVACRRLTPLDRISERPMNHNQS